jgi:hypothetical protein
MFMQAKAALDPSGVAEPSQADEARTARIRDALSLVDIRVLDHIIVAEATQRGLCFVTSDLARPFRTRRWLDRISARHLLDYGSRA